jgi:alpha-L-rhamnosidase
MDLTIRYHDGSEQRVLTKPASATDAQPQWLGTTDLNPIRYTHLYHGEIVDARVGDPAWDTSKYTPHLGPAGWQPALAYAHAAQLGATFTLLEAPPIAATNAISPVNISTLGRTPTSYVFDFGNNMAGFARMQTAVALPPGTVVTLKYGEVLTSSGSVSLPWGDGPGINQANQTDQYTFRGEAGESFTPSFTYHGFRYVQVDGLPDGVAVDARFLTALFVRTAIRRSGDVHFGPRPHAADAAAGYPFAILNEIQAAVVQTQASNVHSHPTDCPQREKRGWTGDGQVTSGQCALNFDATATYAQWLQSMEDSAAIGCALAPQTPAFPQPACFECCDPSKPAFGCDYTGLPPGGTGGGFSAVAGSVADVVPYMHVGGWPGDPSWGIAGATIPWEVMAASGDLSFAERFYPLAKGVVDFMGRNGDPALGGVVTFGYYGDWLSLEKSPTIPKPQVTGWSHLLGVARVADMARRLGKTSDAQFYSAQLANLTQAYRRAYQLVDGSFGSSQTANVLGLYLNLTSGDERATAAATAALVADLAKHGNRTLSGLVGVSYIFQALMQAGRHELALSIASALDQPSWGYMVRTGPGTIWETWDDTTNSHNHPMFTASIGKYLYALGGLQPDAWAEANVPELRPAGGDAATAALLGSATVSVASRRGAGSIHMSWKYAVPTNGRRFAANVSVPFGFEKARVLLPPLETGAAGTAATKRGSFVMVEQRSGLRFRCAVPDGDDATPVVVDDARGELRRAGVLRLMVGGAGVWSEATVVPGDYELVVEPA